MPKQLTILAEPTPPEVQKLPELESYDYQFLNPYDADTKTHPYDGKIVILSDSEKIPGVAAIWRVSRKLEGWRWRTYSQWVTPLTNVKISFDPVYWRKFSGYSE